MAMGISSLLSRVDAWPLRTRALALMVLLATLFLVWEGLLSAPLDRRAAAEQARAAQLRGEIATLQAQVQRLAHQRLADPNRAVGERLAALRREGEALGGRLADLTAQLIPAERMPGLIESVLTRETSLRLLRLEGTGVEPAFASPDPPEGDSTPDAPAGLYRHGLRLVFEGSYAESLGYLRSLEALPGRLLWERLSLEVVAYPVSRVTLEVATLSLDPDWIGL